ncbi:MAG: hypothetical protein HY066_04630 [Betaproteobacteria bacterium]|nr:hypothetical protein [Betaproteobacteria bacterium]
MSPSWRDRFEIALCSDEVTVRHLSAGWRSKEETVVVRASTEKLMDSVGNILDRFAVNERVRIPATAEVVLSESFVRHSLLPWSPLVRGKSERAALLQACFEDAYGEPALSWRLVADRGEYAAAAPACGVEQVLLADIAAVLASRRIRLRSVSSFFSAVFNRYRLEPSLHTTVFAAGDSEWATLATFVDGHWNSLRSVRLTGDPEDLHSALSREALLQGLPKDARKLLCFPGNVSQRVADSGVEFLRPWGIHAKPEKSAALLTGGWPR